MNYKDLRIIFMGTPEFAVASLQALVNEGCNVVGVVTAPDKPAGRGLQLTQSAVKKFAVENGLKILQPLKLKDPEFIQSLKELNADMQAVVAFRMLPEIVWNMPPMGTVNVHGSLLPQYRGAAPINWAIINGEKFTGVTTFKLQQAIDTGNILLQQKIEIGEDETAGELHNKMKLAGANLLMQTLRGLADGTVKERPQDNLTEDPAQLKHAPKIFTETCRIAWEKDVDSIHNLIRGLSPFPAAFTTLQDKVLKIYKSSKEPASHTHAAGTFLTDGKTFFKFACAGGYIHAHELQLEGKKRLTAEDFLRGFRA
ncbi:MAG: methionyl-tRNA formyltransferase [Chitinophagaceae bacterium]|nr:methionyl-tRNA formyltransferase [Chitinophagaceae bacterium]